MTTALRPWELHPPARHRLPRYPALPVHVWIGTAGGRPTLGEPRLARLVFEALAVHPRTRCGLVLPDRLHWLLDDGRDLPRLVARFKSATARLVVRAGGPPRLWQRSFLDTVLRRRSAADLCLTYLTTLPARRNLLAAGGDYPYLVTRQPAAGAATPTSPRAVEPVDAIRKRRRSRASPPA